VVGRAAAGQKPDGENESQEDTPGASVCVSLGSVVFPGYARCGLCLLRGAVSSLLPEGHHGGEVL